MQPGAGRAVRRAAPAARSGSLRRAAGTVRCAACARARGRTGTAAAEKRPQLSRWQGGIAGVAGAWCLGLAAASAAEPPQRANFEQEAASKEARHVAHWVMHARDNHMGDGRRLPFALVDKREAKVFVFDADGRLRGAAPALLGLARGDDAVPGIGDRPLSTIRDHEKTTPAGRFVSALGGNLRGEDVLWVDYETATSMHRVLTTNAKERRAHRLATPTPEDNRISYGCINIPVKFFEDVVRPAFTGTYGIVYVLPETRSARAVFASFDVEGDAAAEPEKLAAQRSRSPKKAAR